MKENEESQEHEIDYGPWEIHPELAPMTRIREQAGGTWQFKTTKHEGDIMYRKHWNFWVRHGVEADTRDELYFRGFGNINEEIKTLMNAIALPKRRGGTEEQIWNRVGKVWNWLRQNVQYDPGEYPTITSVDEEWPSLTDYAMYFTVHGRLIWSNCFSRAHLFANLLGQVELSHRYRFAIAFAHHTENGALPSASHVYVAIYVSDRWFYLDPTAVYVADFPEYGERRSIGVDSFNSVDYQHPFKLIPVPLSGLEKVPFLPA